VATRGHRPLPEARMSGAAVRSSAPCGCGGAGRRAGWWRRLRAGSSPQGPPSSLGWGGADRRVGGSEAAGRRREGLRPSWAASGASLRGARGRSAAQVPRQLVGSGPLCCAGLAVSGSFPQCAVCLRQRCRTRQHHAVPEKRRPGQQLPTSGV